MRSFSFVELVIVLVIVGVLAILALPSFKVARDNALNREAEANLKLIQAAERIYRMEVSAYYDCDDTAIINAQLFLAIPITNPNWDYKVDSDGSTFTARARNTKDASIVWCIDPSAEKPSACSW